MAAKTTMIGRVAMGLVAGAAVVLGGCGAERYTIDVGLSDSLYDAGQQRVRILHTVYFISTRDGLEDQVLNDLNGQKSFFDPTSDLRRRVERLADESESSIERITFAQGSSARLRTLERGADIWSRWGDRERILVVAVPPLGLERSGVWHQMIVRGDERWGSRIELLIDRQDGLRVLPTGG